jgi:acyl-CoA thioesterase I
MDDPRRFTARTRHDLADGCEVTVVAFGDSITAGFAVRHSFPYFWKLMLAEKYPEARIKIINSGTSGDTTLDGLAKLDWAVLSHNPDLVTVNFGINDAVMGLSLEEFRSSFAEIAERIVAARADLLLLSSQPLETPGYDKLVLNYYREIEELARDMDVGFVDVYRAWMDRVEQGTMLGSLILSGLDHPNEAGYKIIAEELMKFF